MLLVAFEQAGLDFAILAGPLRPGQCLPAQVIARSRSLRSWA
jgi:hypothetical protein